MGAKHTFLFPEIILSLDRLTGSKTPSGIHLISAKYFVSLDVLVPERVIAVWQTAPGMSSEGGECLVLDLLQLSGRQAAHLQFPLEKDSSLLPVLLGSTARHCLGSGCCVRLAKGSSSEISEREEAETGIFVLPVASL